MAVIYRNEKAVLYKEDINYVGKLKATWDEVYYVYSIKTDGRWVWPENLVGKTFRDLQEAKTAFLLESI